MEDVGSHNQDGMVLRGLRSTQHLSLSAGQVPVLQRDAGAKELALSPVGELSGELTLEAWVRPDDASRQQAVLRVGNEHRQIVLCAGGSSHELSVVLLYKTTAFVLCSVSNQVESNVFTHIAAVITTVHQNVNGTMTPYWQILLYKQGQQIGSTLLLQSDVQDRSTRRSQILKHCLLSPLSTTCAISGRVGLDCITMSNDSPGRDGSWGDEVEIDEVGASRPYAFEPLTGQIAEVRIWKTAVDPQSMASRFLGRLVGNESGLVASYRLEQDLSGFIYDISGRRGLGQLSHGSRITTTTALPLLPTKGDIYLDVKGKLLHDTLLLASTSSVPTPLTGDFFDATFVARQDSTGVPMRGTYLKVMTDAEVDVFIPQGALWRKHTWTPGMAYAILLPADGKIRLCFAATDLTLPTLRARVDAMEPNLWTVVRPDREALNRLASQSGDSLLRPASGKTSPLRAGSSDWDAERVAAMLNRIGRAYGPPQLQDEGASLRGWLGTLSSAGQAAWSALGNAGTVAANTVVRAGEAAGSLAQAIVDSGTTDFKTATSSVTSACSLVVSGISTALSDLLIAASKSAARYGTAAIEECVSSANSLAVVALQGTSAVAHTFAIVGTSLIGGTTYVWRVVCAGVLDAISTAKAFLKKIGTEIKALLAYLAYLFNWRDILNASDALYEDLQEYLDGIPAAVDRIAPICNGFYGYLTIPDNLGNKTLGDLCRVSIADTPSSCYELEYFLEKVQQLFGSPDLGLGGGLSDAMAPLSDLATRIDLSPEIDTVSGRPSGAISLLTNPASLFNTSLQDLLSGLLSGSTSNLGLAYAMSTVVGAVTESLSGLIAAFKTHINVPVVTGVIEGLMGGRSLNLLRLGAFVAAIAKVLTVKVMSSIRGSSTSTSRGISFSADDEVRDAAWGAFAFGLLFGTVGVVRAGLELTNASRAARAGLDAVLGLLMTARACCGEGMLRGQPVAAQATMAIQYAVEIIAGLAQIGFSAVGYWGVGYGSTMNLGVQCCVLVILLVDAFVAAGLNVYQSGTDWTGFGLTVLGNLFTQSTAVLAAAADQSATSGKKLAAQAQMALAGMAGLADLGLAGLDAYFAAS